MEDTRYEKALRIIDYSSEEIEKILSEVICAMKEKNYNPITQLMGYLVTGEPTYITAYDQARIKIQKIDRNLLLQMMVENFIEKIDK